MSYIKAYEDYFEELAGKYKPIGHTDDERRFESMSQEAIISGVRNNLNLTQFCLLLLRFDVKLVKNGTRHYRQEFTAAFEIVKDIARNDLAKTETQDKALEYCEELIAHIQNENFARAFPLGELIDDSIEFYPIEAIFDTCVGYGCEFKFFIGYNRVAKIKTQNWN